MNIRALEANIRHSYEVGTQILYVPQHIDRSVGVQRLVLRKDLQLGFIFSVPTSTEYFCRYWNYGYVELLDICRSHPEYSLYDLLRTKSCSEKTLEEDLIPYNYMGQSLIDKVIEQIKEEQVNIYI